MLHGLALIEGCYLRPTRFTDRGAQRARPHGWLRRGGLVQ